MSIPSRRTVSTREPNCGRATATTERPRTARSPTAFQARARRFTLRPQLTDEREVAEAGQRSAAVRRAAPHQSGGQRDERQPEERRDEPEAEHDLASPRYGSRLRTVCASPISSSSSPSPAASGKWKSSPYRVKLCTSISVVSRASISS